MNMEHLESDLNIAAFLAVKGLQLLGIGSPTGRRYPFKFNDPENQAAAFRLAYLSGAEIPARQFAEAEKSLKSLLYSVK